MTGRTGFHESRLLPIAVGIAIATLFLSSCEVTAAAEPGKKPVPGSEIFDGTNILRLNITIPTDGWRTLKRYYWGNGGRDKPEVKATVSDGTRVYNNVALHMKGAAGSFRPIDDKPGLTLNFDKFVPGQKFHGLEKISLNNSVQDPTYVEEKLCREMYEAAGVPVPRADYALVTLNGRGLGLYVLLEGYNKQFLKRYFKNVSGNLYDGGFCREITDGLDVNSGDKPNDRSDLQRLASAAVAARKNNSLSELSQVLDIDRFLTMVALEVIQCHWDGYTMNRNNYRVFHDLDSGKMVFMPHGMDQMFGTGDRGSPQGPIIPPMNGFVSSAVLGTTEGRTRYLQRLAEIRTNIFVVEAVTNRVRELDDRIRAFSRSNPFSHRRSNIDWLCQSIVERARSLDQQLAAPPQPATFTNGILRLTGWRPRNMNGTGDFDIATSRDGKRLLHITGTGESSAASWRTKVTLPLGRYRFEGYTRTRAAGTGPNGAHLRISGSMGTPVLHGDNEWTMLNFPFDVMEPMREVELVCELKGNKGEVWFDTTSLKVRRVE